MGKKTQVNRILEMMDINEDMFNLNSTEYEQVNEQDDKGVVKNSIEIMISFMQENIDNLSESWSNLDDTEKTEKYNGNLFNFIEQMYFNDREKGNEPFN